MRVLSTEELKYLADGNVIKYRVLEDGSIVGIMLLLTTFALISDVGTKNSESFYYHRFCYKHQDIALVLDALDAWDGKSKPLKGYVAYKGGNHYLAHADEDRKLRGIAMEDQDVV